MLRSHRRAASPIVIWLLCAQLMACGVAVANEQITVQALAAQLEQSELGQVSAPLILDVRSPQEYAQGHIPGAINIDYREILGQIETIRAFNSPEIILYCERGVRAGVAERTLAEAGVESVQLAGNIRAWRKAGLPLETGH